MPVATYVSTAHDACSIPFFLEQFMTKQVQTFGSQQLPHVVIIDGTFAMWNAVLGCMCKENRLEYYKRCSLILMEEPHPTDMKKTILLNCPSHAMKAAKILCKKYYKKKYLMTAMHWVSLMFQAETLLELDSIVSSFIALTNCEVASNILDEHFVRLQYITMQIMKAIYLGILEIVRL